MKKIKYLIILSLFAPLFASAQLTGTARLLGSAYGILTSVIIPLVFTLALLFFFWGIVKYIKSEGEGKDEGRKIMIWGVVALFVMSSVWGLVYFLRDELISGYNNTSAPIPTIGGSGAGAPAGFGPLAP